MARARSQFVCQSCGNITNRWNGRCEACGEWNSIVEEAASGPTPAARPGRVVPLGSLEGEGAAAPRTASGIAELDRVTGGGFVRGSAILLGGDPGIGKSTLLLQAAAAIAARGGRVVYITGEEAADQVRLRAQRLGLAGSAVGLAAETSVEDILATLTAAPPPALIVIDSIQTAWTASIESAPGTVSQVRASSHALIRYAKQSGAALVLVGHVTKDGQIAGPRVVEHMVDAVMGFEGDGSGPFRILRTTKNRFGPTDEIGVFEMTGAGLKEVLNPSELFLGDRDRSSPGTAVFAGIEGTRPLLVEIQALVAPSPLANPRRATVGWDGNRLSMILAVLEARCGIRFGVNDVYLNVAGGLRIVEPAADLAVAAALLSSLSGVALPADCVYFGEVSLTGGIRPVGHVSTRLKEAEKLGFRQAVLPEASIGDEVRERRIAVTGLRTLLDLVGRVAASSIDDGELSPPTRAGVQRVGAPQRSGNAR
ncbi:DNA repair protein RadA [Pseudoxanthobacter sp. M-2]|uniref:DNA repair protein RadA n=1 Tax=Pseudoxanthobacter sp. M-2 TaxID=3078754 RepID=UPI0038FD3BFD